MNTIGAIGYERQLETRPAAPTAGSHDGDRDRKGNRDKDRDGEPADDASPRGTATAQNVADRMHKVNVTA
jgi:hypothetical protein